MESASKRRVSTSQERAGARGVLRGPDPVKKLLDCLPLKSNRAAIATNALSCANSALATCPAFRHATESTNLPSAGTSASRWPSAPLCSSDRPRATVSHELRSPPARPSPGGGSSRLLLASARQSRPCLRPPSSREQSRRKLPADRYGTDFCPKRARAVLHRSSPCPEMCRSAAQNPG